MVAFSPRKSMVGPTSRVLRKWDELNIRRKCVGIASVDAHAFPIKVGPLTVRIFPYKVHFRTLRTHLILSEPLSRDLPVARRQIYDALRDCRAFGTNLRWGGAEGFEFYAITSAEKVTIGGQIPYSDDLHLQVNLPRAAEIRLIGNGQRLLDTTTRQVEYKVTEPGLYRVEVWQHKRCWIFTNHIRIEG
jgi:hypothetical protein